MIESMVQVGKQGLNQASGLKPRAAKRCGRRGGRAAKPMRAFVLKTRVSENGILTIHLPSEYAGRVVELVVVLQPLIEPRSTEAAQPYESLNDFDSPMDGAERLRELLPPPE